MLTVTFQLGREEFTIRVDGARAHVTSVTYDNSIHPDPPRAAALREAAAGIAAAADALEHGMWMAPVRLVRHG